MLNRFFGNNTHTIIHLVAIGGVAAGVPFNKIMMSLSMMLMVLNLLLEAKFNSYWTNLKSNRIYHFILVFFLLHVLGLVWTTNMSYAIHDLNGKLPLLVIPTILSAKPIEKRSHLNLILTLFIGSTIILSIINYVFYQHYFGNIIYNDIRGMSLFGSHIRFAIIVSMSCGIILYFVKNRVAPSWILALFLGWLTFYTVYSQVLSGSITLVAIVVAFIVYYSYRKKKILTILSISLLITAVISLLLWLFNPMTLDMSKYKNLEKHTAEGNLYEHSVDLITVETGEPMHIYICHEELSRDWPKYSKIPYYDNDIKGQPLQHTLLRYLSSKNLRKDAQGLAQLTEQDIRNVENGIASYYHNGLSGRLYSIKHQLINEDNPTGHSLLERMEFWRAGYQIALDNIVIGVGTGDVQDSFDREYSMNGTRLESTNWRRAHNMFLTMIITFGIFGGVYFLWIHFYFLVKNLRSKEIVPILFVVLILTSYLVEDTLETQTGVTLFALFYGLYCVPIKSTEA